MALVDSMAALANGDGVGHANELVEIKEALGPAVTTALQGVSPEKTSRAQLSRIIKDAVLAEAARQKLSLNLLQERNLVTLLLNSWLAGAQNNSPRAPVQPASAAAPSHGSAASGRPVESIAELAAASRSEERAGLGSASRSSVEAAAEKVRPALSEQMDIGAAAKLTRGELARQISEIVSDTLRAQQIQLNSIEQRDLVTVLVNDMLGLGPLEALLADESVTDILVNGPHQIYVERKGKLVLTDLRFRDNAHAMAICTRIVSRIGRRVDETSPMCDARLPDGSRVNIIIPPLALDGPSISIRKFAEKKITLEMMTEQGNISQAMETVLKIAARSRLNVLISGGTGSGKTTLLNALSRLIDTGERVVTIEDAAELQLQQPHVVRLETRPVNIEGKGEVGMRDLVKNALRMRPDRIILGEVRGSEAIDMLQAMNTGHEGSMCTIHANNPREALTRLENMIAMANVNLPPKALRTQVASAIDLIVQISRMRDGMRRVMSVTEVVGMEGDVITTQELFRYRYQGEAGDGRLLGEFEPAGVRPNFHDKASYFGLDRPLMEALA